MTSKIMGRPFNTVMSRRHLLKQLGSVGIASLARPLLANVVKAAERSTPLRGTGSSLIRHVVIAIQENRSFDHYYGYASFAGRFGVPQNYSQPDAEYPRPRAHLGRRSR